MGRGLSRRKLFSIFVFLLSSQLSEKVKIDNVTSLVKSIEEVANNTVPFPSTADHNGLSHFTGVRTFFPTEDMLSML